MPAHNLIARLRILSCRHLVVVVLGLFLMASFGLMVDTNSGFSVAYARGGSGGGGGGGGDGGGGSGGDGGGGSGGSSGDGGSGPSSSGSSADEGGSAGHDPGSSAGTGTDADGSTAGQAGRGLGDDVAGEPGTGGLGRGRARRLGWTGSTGKALSRAAEASTIARNWGGSAGSE